MPIDLTKPVQTKDGRPVRILCTDRADVNYPVVGMIDGREIKTWTNKGYESLIGISTNDLVNAPETNFFYVNIYPKNELLVPERTREEADDHASQARIACVRIEWKNGQFDD